MARDSYQPADAAGEIVEKKTDRDAEAKRKTSRRELCFIFPPILTWRILLIKALSSRFID